MNDAKNGMKILALVEAPDHVCSRYRISAFRPALEAAGCSLTLASVKRSWVERLRQLSRAAQFDVVILQRKLMTGFETSFLRRRARRLVFDFDDAVFYRDSYHRRGIHSRQRRRRFAKIVGAADAVIAGNSFLSDSAMRWGASEQQVHLIPTCVRPELYTGSVGSASPGANSGVRLVWIGSASTLQGLERSRALWDRVGLDVQGSSLHVISDRFPSFETMPVVSVPWSEAAEASDLASCDVGINWMPDDLWSRGKCGLKILQYQAAALPVVANPVGVHVEMIETGRTGRLPSSDGEWVDALYELSTDQELRARMGRNGRESVEARYSVDRWAQRFVAAVLG
jgi:glycosyltransferase involved in cell wall biosynthesis